MHRATWANRYILLLENSFHIIITFLLLCILRFCRVTVLHLILNLCVTHSLGTHIPFCSRCVFAMIIKRFDMPSEFTLKYYVIDDTNRMRDDLQKCNRTQAAFQPFKVQRMLCALLFFLLLCLSSSLFRSLSFPKSPLFL